MNVLLLHRSFPSQFRYLAAALAQEPGNRVVFATNREPDGIAGVEKVMYHPVRETAPETHPYVKDAESAVLHGQGAYRVMAAIKQQGFVPDVIYGHSRWGPTLYAKDLFPRTPLVCYFEWFYRADDVGDEGAKPAARVKNVPLLLDLFSCDQGVCPTKWQHSQFPPEYRGKIQVLHDGVDTDFFQPQAGGGLTLPAVKLNLAAEDEVLTYVTRGMEPLRGFPQFMEAVSLLQQWRPRMKTVIVGWDMTVYGQKPDGGKTYKQQMLEKLPFDQSRLHFTGWLPLADYRRVLQASSVHVYLTEPFILSWSLMEAMATGCLLVASNTPPVAEMITHGVNGLLADLHSPRQIAETIFQALENRAALQKLRASARETIVGQYDLNRILPLQRQMLLRISGKT